AQIIFATTRVGLRLPWGTTHASQDDVVGASLLLIGGDKPGSPWLLMKSNDANKALFIIRQLNVSGDPVRLVPVQSASVCPLEHFIRYEHGLKRINIYFEDAEMFYSFLAHSYTPRRCDDSFDKRRGAGLTIAILQPEWTSFDIPCEWP
ncbi:hypothetical protein BJ138DRAFT_973674, partial [Hygrophoropsis aurantiaca]